MELSTAKAHYERQVSIFNTPMVTGFYSVNEEGRYFLSTKNASYLNWRQFSSRSVNLDLTEGENESTKRTDENSFAFYRYLVDHPTKVHNFSSNTLEKCGFICTRKVLRKISDLPYQNENDELFSAFLYQGNIYLSCITPEKQRNPRNVRWSRWEHKFEQYLLSKIPGLEPITNIPVKEAEEFNCVLTLELNNHRLLFGVEMDGIIIESDEEFSAVSDIDKFPENVIIEELRKRKFVELKTYTFSETNINFMKTKSRDIWLQNFFGGVEIVIIGTHDYYGIVRKIKRINTQDLLQIGKGFWSPEVCTNFCDWFLTFIKDCFQIKMSHILAQNPNCDIRDLPPMELLFERKLFSNVVMTENGKNISKPYMSQWFLDGVSRK